MCLRQSVSTLHTPNKLPLKEEKTENNSVFKAQPQLMSSLYKSTAAGVFDSKEYSVETASQYGSLQSRRESHQTKENQAPLGSRTTFMGTQSAFKEASST